MEGEGGATEAWGDEEKTDSCRPKVVALLADGATADGATAAAGAE